MTFCIRDIWFHHDGWKDPGYMEVDVQLVPASAAKGATNTRLRVFLPQALKEEILVMATIAAQKAELELREELFREMGRGVRDDVPR